jgi:hypothetical protein
MRRQVFPLLFRELAEGGQDVAKISFRRRHIRKIGGGGA